MDWTKLLRDWGRVTVGILLILVGIAGLVLPIVPGVLPILAGLALLAPASPFVRRLRARMRGAARELGSGTDS